MDGGLCRVADPLREPRHLWATLRAPVGTMADKVRIATLRRRATRGELGDVLAKPETTALEALRAHGFGEAMIERFLRPWLGGIFLENELTTSSRMMEFVFRMFAEGEAAVPARGMQAIPDQLAAGLPAGAVRLGERVAALEGHGVRLASGEHVCARDVVVATDGAAAARLLPEIVAPKWRATTTVYFAAERSPVNEGTLVLNGTGRGRVNHLAVMSDVAPTYSPDGRALIAVSLVGDVRESDAELMARVRAELAEWLGADVNHWQWLKAIRVPQALPVRTPLVREEARPLRDGVWVCGDHRDTASIQGAMRSGREVAEAIILRG